MTHPTTQQNTEHQNTQQQNQQPTQNGVSLSNEAVIFSSIFKDDNEVNQRKQELITSFKDPSIFTNEYHVLHIITRDYPMVEPNEEFIRLFLQTNRSTFTNSQSINLEQYRIGEIDPYVEFVDSCIDIYTSCVEREVTESEFIRSVEMHKMQYVTQHSLEVLEESAMILSQGVNRGRKTLTGYADMRQNLSTKLTELDNIVEKKDRKGVLTYGEDEEGEDEKLERVTTFGINALDKAIGGIYEGDMVSLLAPSKGGKSRFATHVVHNAIVEHGINVAMWSVENGFKGWESLIRARHFNWYYNSRITDVAQKRIIDSDMIRKGELEGELKEMEQASWLDLKHNKDYGRITVIDEEFFIEDFIEIVERVVNDKNIGLVCVDYLQLIGGQDTRMAKNERIGTAYIRMLQLLKKKKIGGIFPGQLKQSVVGDIQRVDPEELVNMELRDAAGESYEVIKTPDVNLALYGTVEDIRNGAMKLLSIPSRNSAPFEPIDLYVDAGTCSFSSIDRE